MLELWLPLAIFASVFAMLVFEVFDKSIIALVGAMLMILVGAIDPEQAFAAVEWGTIFLLLGMMLLVHMAAQSGILDWLKVKITTMTGGVPWKIFLFFSLLTAVMSAFLDNVTTVILIVPITIVLLRGIGQNPRYYVFAEIMFSNIGGALTLIGDPPNIIIGGQTGFGMMDFISNLWLPIGAVMLIIGGYSFWSQRRHFFGQPQNWLEDSLLSLLIAKIRHQFIRTEINTRFVWWASLALAGTIAAFFLHEIAHIPAFVAAIMGAMVLAMLNARNIDIHKSFSSVEWSTLFFFIGLFIIVGAIEHTGILETVGYWLTTQTEDLLLMTLIILWGAGLISMLLDNIPFVVVMLPIVAQLQTAFGPEATILWWALSLGACLGGNGTLIGASANVVAANMANRENVGITFLNYTRFALPLTLVMLVICSLYFWWKLG